MKRSFFLLLLTFATLISCKEEHSNLPDGLYAEIETNKGNIITQLEFEKTPITVANFVSLAEGKNTFVNAEYKGKPFFDGLKWHRVIKDFMIQGGDPLGNGSGDTGYKFKDEFTDLKHDKPGVMSMANGGPGTNSSQFFITHVPTPWLDGKHTIFGHVVEGMDIVNNIEQNDGILSVKIIRKGDAAKKFDAVKIFTDFFKNEAEAQKKQAITDGENKAKYDAQYKVVKEQRVASIAELRKTATKTKSGLAYKIIKKGSGKKPAAGAPIYIHYAGFLEDGSLFDTSIESVAKIFGKFDQRRADAQQYLPIPWQAGKKDGMIPGFIEGIEQLSYGDKAIIFIPSNLAYGAQGAGGVIPPNANIVFEIELFENQNN
ncbi:peptidylprolyl isomerase [Flavobacterium noncentrifugens]|uniref:peptidylprolyl isomerase n=1 Tax=Flavobacterium noncentrifugens TaxID=1128970 RepID=A0A1G8YT92_9FLAO|nr:peptidylprolyl isomerase [Flavobacterium noncentrifugens]GEP51353.1 peptidylprolyl isomerase [Flavobacterium noncentrifugens]SDK06028.1 peptidylprolyl isomerase [Flavobacterium noncentrifugens]